MKTYLYKNFILSLFKKEPFCDFDESQKGFSLIELTAVIVVLSVLGSLTLPNISKWIKLSRIDEAKNLVNSSIAECLQGFRDGTAPSDLIPPDSIISNDRLEKLKYKIKTSDKDCSSFFITPTSSSEKTLFEFGFKISPSGNITKIANPNDDNSSLGSCKRWGGINCGATQEQLDAWAAQEALEKAKQECEANYGNWLVNTPPNGGTGSFNRWDPESDSCSLTVYAFEGTRVADADAVEAAQAQKLGAICNSKVQEAKNNKTTGQTTFSECPEQIFYFCLGEDKQTLENMNVCVNANAEAKCLNQLETTRQESINNDSIQPNGPNGKFGPLTGPGKCGVPKWICKGKEHSSENEYNADPNCAEPPPPQCSASLIDHPNNVSLCGPGGVMEDYEGCQEWNECSGFMPYASYTDEEKEIFLKMLE